MILYRCFAWSRRARASDENGVLWVPRAFQGEGRHDNPDVYGCLYLADREASGVVEQLARFRGQRLVPSLLRRRGLPLGLAELELDDAAAVLDLDEPRTLVRERLSPSRVATRRRDVTQPWARTLWERRADCAGIRWWSVFESLWANVTLFDRALPSVRVRGVRELTLDDPAVAEAAELLAFRVG